VPYVDLQTGDIILTSKKSAIARFMDFFQKDPCVWGHVLVVKDPKTGWEASWKIREVEIKKVFEKHKYYKILRKRDLSARQKELMIELAPKIIGRVYGIRRIFLQLLDQVFHTNWFTTASDSIYCQVCSSYAAWIYEMACRYKFNGVPWQSCDPDDIEDDQLAHPETWVTLQERRLRRSKWQSLKRLLILR